MFIRGEIMRNDESLKYVLRTKKLNKIYKKEHVVNNVSMNIKKGDIYMGL